MKLPTVSAIRTISLDGKIVVRSRRGAALAHELRVESDAILLGRGALEADDMPAEPLRVIFIDSGRLRRSLRILQDGAPVVVFTTKAMPAATRRRLEKFAVIHVEPRAKKVSLRRSLQILARDHGVRSALCMGGGELLRAFLRQGLVDALHITILPVVMGGKNAPTLLGPAHSSLLSHSIPLRLESVRQRDAEVLATYRVLRAAAPRGQ